MFVSRTTRIIAAGTDFHGGPSVPPLSPVNLFLGELIQTLLLRAFEDAWSHSGAEGGVVVRMVISSFSAMERPSRLSIAILWFGERSLALWVMRVLMFQPHLGRN
jgi:hypothetical protein